MENKTILVVGGAGYIGSHMVQVLLENHYRVLILDNFSTGFRQLVVGGDLVEGRLGDPVVLDRVFSGNRIDAVMHFAAFSQVGESVRVPLKYYRNNVAETIALIQAMVRFDVRRFIFSSTAAVYGEPEAVPIAEDHPCRPTSPYGNGKLAVEQMLADCDAAYGLKSVCLRYFNAAGAHPSGQIGEMHDPETHLIPLVLKAARSSSAIQVFGSDYPTADGTCIRDYVHVSDLARAHLLALEALTAGGGSDTFNLGNSVGYSVREVIRIAEKVAGKSIAQIKCGRRPGDPAVLVADSSKIRNVLGWRPRYEDLESIVATAWGWHGP
jgi:UDP-glucose 4-epimerase